MQKINIKKKPKLFCKKFSKKELKKLPKFDIILLSGLIHHLSDQESKQLLVLCKKILKKEGKLITIDPILIKNILRIVLIKFIYKNLFHIQCL